MDPNVAALVSEFGKRVGLPDLIFDDAGYCCLIFDDTVINLEVHEDLGILYLYSRVGDLPPENVQNISTLLLEANYLFRGTSGCVLGIDVNKRHIVLAYQAQYRFLDIAAFETMLENFLHVAEKWTKKLTSNLDNGTPPSTPSGLPQYSIQV